MWTFLVCINVNLTGQKKNDLADLITIGWGDINLSRNRHADEIKDTVDVEFIVADTIRIATDDAVINNARSAVLNHGAAKVKLIATKIDAGPFSVS